MQDKKILKTITLTGLGGLLFLFRKRNLIKDWFLVYLFKTLVSTLVDTPVLKKKYVQYPYRYFPNLFDSNIVFLYLVFPVSCVIYNQFTYKMQPLKTIISVFYFSVPMTLIESWLERNTNLVRFRKGWNSLYSFLVLSVSFWIVRALIEGIRIVDKKIRSIPTVRSKIIQN